MKRNSLQPKMGIFFSIVLIFLIIVTTCLLTLLFWGFLKSLQSVDAYLLNGAAEADLPYKLSDMTFTNYIDAFSKLKYGEVYLAEMFGNSIFYSAGCAFCSTMVPCIVGYATARYKVWFNKVISFIIYFNMVFQFYGAMPSMIQITDLLGLRNTWPGIFIMKSSILGGGYLFFHVTFRALAKDYSEAAIIDGANHWQIMVDIVFPLAKTIILVQFVAAFITCWNDYQTPLIYLNNAPTAAYGLFLFSQSTDSYTDYLVYKLAGFMLLLIPTFTVFMFLKKYFLGEVTAGGVKE